MLIRLSVVILGMGMMMLALPATVSADEGYLVASQYGAGQKAKNMERKVVRKEAKRERKAENREVRERRKAEKKAYKGKRSGDVMERQGRRPGDVMERPGGEVME